MVFTIRIIEAFLSKYELTSVIDERSIHIRTLRFADSDDLDNRSIVYVSTSENGRDVICRNLDSVITVHNAPEREVFNRLLERMNYYNEWEIHALNAVTGRKSFADCMEMLAQLFPGRIVTIFSQTGDVLFDNESPAARTMSPEVVKYIRDDQICHRIATGSSGVNLFWEEHFEANIILGNFVYNNGAFLLFSIKGTPGNPLLDEHLRLAGFSKYIFEHMSYSVLLNAGVVSYRNIVKSMLRSEPVSEESVAGFERFLGWQVEDGTYLCAIRNYPRDDFAENSLKSMLADKFTKLFVFEYEELILCLLPAAQMDLRLSDFEDTIASIEFKAGISLRFVSWEQLPRALFQSRLVVSKIAEDGVNGCVGLCRDYAWEHYLSILRNNGAFDTLHSDVMRLTAYNRRKDIDLLDTLAVYLKNDQIIQKTAEQLNIHHNTVKYRLEKVAELVDLDFHDYQSRMHFLVSYDLVRPTLGGTEQ